MRSKLSILTNQNRADNGLPPLKMNWQLTQSARWFSQDKSSVAHSPDCSDTNGHQDSFGNYPNTRAVAFGYQGLAGAEDVWCTFLEPPAALEGWMNSSGHRANILDPNSREVGVGYSQTNGGWIAEDFGADSNYAPVVIDNEALQTTSPDVDLYIYNVQIGNHVQSLRPAVQMQVGEDECALGSDYQAFSADPSYSLSSGEGWKTVYVRSRDAYGHTSIASDTIYLGDTPPLDEIGEAQMSTIASSVKLYQLNGDGRGYVQFSPGWLGDGFMDGNNNLLPQSADSDAWDGKAVVLSTQNGQNFSWVWTTSFVENTPLVAYVRLKVSDKQQSGELASILISAGANSYGPVHLTGADFPASNQYVEIPVPFTYSPTTENPFMEFVVQRSGSAAVSLDAITVFSAPQPLTGSSMTWSVPGGHYRGEGIWVRYSNADGSNFTPFSEGVTAVPALSAAPSSFNFMADLQPDHLLPTGTLTVGTTCGTEFNWTATSEAGWLQATTQGSRVSLAIDRDGLTPGEYDTRLALQADNPAVDTIYIPVHLALYTNLSTIYLPQVRR